MKKWKKNWLNLIKMLCVIIAALLIISRIAYVNAYYPKTKCEKVEMNTSFQFHNCELNVEKVMVYSKEEWIAKMSSSDYEKKISDKDFYVYVVELHIKNQSSDENKISLDPFVLESGAMNNKCDIYDTSFLNGSDKISSVIMLDGNAEKESKMVFYMYKSYLKPEKWKTVLSRPYQLRILNFEKTLKVELSLDN